MAETEYGPSRFGFEDLETYKSARTFRNRMYALTKQLPGIEKFAMVPQVQRAAISLTNNIAEGYGRYGWQDTTRFILISRASLFELIDDLNICADQNYIAANQLTEYRQDATHLLHLINGYVAYLSRSKKGLNGEQDR